MKQTKPAQAMELRSLSPVFDGLIDEVGVEFRGANLPARYQELQKYPVRLTLPVYFRGAVSPVLGGTWANGSGCLLRFDDRVFGVTCRHVIEGYRRRRESEPSAVFCFGPVQLEPDAHLVAENAHLDLVTLDLTEYVRDGHLEAATCIDPVRWPPEDVSNDDVLAYGGFPGVWREEVTPDYLRFYSFGSGAAAVHSVAPDHLYSRIEPDKCVADLADRRVIGSIGGLSGSPVFAWRTGAVVFAEFVGIVTEYQESYDLLYVQRATCLQLDGTLRE